MPRASATHPSIRPPFIGPWIGSKTRAWWIIATWMPASVASDASASNPTTAVEHHHFICVACGSVIEFQARALEAIKAEFAGQHGAAVEHAALTLYGTCAACGQAGLDV